MNQTIEKYLNTLFEGLNLSDELKEELSLNLNDKYDDLINDGVDPETAYKQVIAGIGDIEELSQTPNNINQNVEINIQHAPNRNLKIGIAVFLFIMSVVPLIILDEFAPDLEVIGVAIMFVFIASGVMILITLPKGLNVSEENKPKKEPKVETPKNKLKQSIQGLLWTCTILVFFLLTYMDISSPWLIFVIAGLGAQLIEVLMTEEKGKNLKSIVISAIWTLMVVLFFTLRFNYSWLFFILGAILTQLVNILFELKEATDDIENK